MGRGAGAGCADHLEIHRVTPTQIIALVRDVAILAGLAFVVFWIWRSGGDRVKVQDMAAVQIQLTANAAKLDAWRKEAADADQKRSTDLEGVRALILQHNQPILVRTAAPAASAGSLPGHPLSASCVAARAGGSDAGSGGSARTIDLRPDIARLELKYESALGDCRAALAKWPQ